MKLSHGVNRIDATFARLRRKRGKALIPYLTVGFPRLSLMSSLIQAAEQAGADLLELGIPFSDPLADGSTIQKASQVALKHGVTPRKVLELVKKVRSRGVRIPLILMTYINPILKYGVRNFCKQAAAVGVDGVIVPDLPPEESAELRHHSRSFGLRTIFLAAPTSTKERLREIVRASTGFIYYVSLTGVTGARQSLPRGLAQDVRRIKRMTKLPVCVGFGISKPEQVKEVVRVADGAIVGSKLLDRIAETRTPVQEAARFIQRLKKAACS